MSGEKTADSAAAIAVFLVLLIGAAAAAAVSAIANTITAPLGLTTGILHDIEHDLSSLGGSMSVPAPMITAYADAAATCPGLPWTILAGIGQAETGNDKNPDQVSTAGAVGPMQFLPSTFARYAYPVPPGGKTPPTPWNPVDAAYAAARLLCANGARDAKNIPAAIYAYNHADWYVTEVLNYAQLYANATANTRLASTDTGGSSPPAGNVTTPPSAAAQTAINYAQAQIGLPYQWGGNGPAAGDTGFDCSGLTQAAYAAAGIPPAPHRRRPVRRHPPHPARPATPTRRPPLLRRRHLHPPRRHLHRQRHDDRRPAPGSRRTHRTVPMARHRLLRGHQASRMRTCVGSHCK